ncbi:hypothetical protein LTR49_028267 [Elasticomyces elasticus]|nr:hypothetical protein LTR49_028267 [Elasticomyces elasticus]
MAPGMDLEIPDVAENFNDHRDGLALEATSNAIDEINVMKAAMRVKNGIATQEEVDIYEKSQFDAEKAKTQFRQYDDACDRVKNFYLKQHEKQTVARERPGPVAQQIEHLLQAAEAIRRDGKRKWFQLTGLVHDIGKLLFFYRSKEQWDVVGDTFPVGCRFDESVVCPGTFEDNPDSEDPI